MNKHFTSEFRTRCLSRLNDTGSTFAEIAESEPEGLFT